jgi:hypothetical protein
VHTVILTDAYHTQLPSPDPVHNYLLTYMLNTHNYRRADLVTLFIYGCLVIKSGIVYSNKVIYFQNEFLLFCRHMQIHVYCCKVNHNIDTILQSEIIFLVNIRHTKILKYSSHCRCFKYRPQIIMTYIFCHMNNYFHMMNHIWKSVSISTSCKL